MGIPGHEMEKVYEDEWRNGYGNMSYKSSKPVLVCSCGYKDDIHASLGEIEAEVRLLRLEHLVDVLTGVSK